MGKLNTNGNAYTIIYSIVMVVIVAFLLAFVASALKPAQDDNEANDKKSQILASLGLPKDSVYNVQEAYGRIVCNDCVYDANSVKVTDKGEISKTTNQADQAGFKIKNKDLKKDKPRPLYVAKVDGETKYVVPMTGAGLWGGLWGYVALNDDCETVYGTYFSHESETAGLGARITEKEFQDSFKGKKLHAKDDKTKVVLSVFKKGKEEGDPENYVNGVTGATLTSNGVNDMIQEVLERYSDILESLKK